MAKPKTLNVKQMREELSALLDKDGRVELLWEAAGFPLAKMTPYDRNPRINKDAIAAVERSLGMFGPVSPIILDEKYRICCGHTRYEAARSLGMKHFPVRVFRFGDEETFKAYNIADNQTASIAEWNQEGLGELISELSTADFPVDALGFSGNELEEILAGLGMDDGADGAGGEPGVEAKQPEALDLVKDCDSVQVQFSGGKDSTVALCWAVDACKKLKKPIEAVFVETGAEFSDLTCHVLHVCERLNVPLKLLHPRENILKYYFEKKRWPDSIFRDCLHKFINDPMDRYLKEKGDERIICVRGGRHDQRTADAKTSLYQKRDMGGGLTVRLLSPFFDASEEDYERVLSEVQSLLWRGYELGFVRTACWCCPFQKVEQWEALKQHYPFLWEEMRRLSTQLEYKLHKGDSTRKRFFAYWRKQKAEPVG